MAVTRSWTAAGAVPVMVRVQHRKPAVVSAWWLVGASVLVAAGLGAVYIAKIQRVSSTHELNLNRVSSPDDLLPILDFLPNRSEVAPRLYDYILRHQIGRASCRERV